MSKTKYYYNNYRSLPTEAYQVPLSTVIYSPPPPLLLPCETGSTIDYTACILPHVLLWNPLQQFAVVFGEKPGCVKERCAGLLKLRCWKVGQTHSLQPRIVHASKCTVLLVAALYSCSFGHEVSSTDPMLTSKLCQEHIPCIELDS